MIGAVPLLRRQLASDALPVALSALIVAAAVALVLVLTGLRNGIGEQVTVYLDHQPSVLVAQDGSVNFLSQVSVIPERVVEDLRQIEGVERADPIAVGYAMLRLHDQRAVSVLVGYETGEQGGPWRLAGGRRPARVGEVAVDEVLAGAHGIEVGDRLAYRGEQLRVVGLSADSNGFMVPLVFTTRATSAMLNGRAAQTNFVLVRPDETTNAGELQRRINSQLDGVVALPRSEVATRDRAVFVGAFGGVLAAMVGIAFIVALVVIATSTYASVAARGKELATVRALGMGVGRLARLAFGHGLALALFGGFVGIALGYLAGWAIHELSPKYVVSIDPAMPAVVLGATLVIGAIAAVVPLRSIMSVDPAGAFQR